MTVNRLAVRLRAREEELSAIYTNIPGILFYIVIEPDGDFRFQSVSRDFLVATGLTRQQVVGSLVRDVIPPPSLGMVLNQYREAIRSGQPVRWEEESVYPTGRKYAEVAVNPLCDASGITTHLIGIVHDITERKRIEEEREEGDLRELNLALEGQKVLLQSREKLLKIFVKNVPAGVAMFDRDMRYLQVSDRWCADYSVGSSELLGRSHYDVFPDMPGHWKEVHCRALEGETLRADEDRWDRGDGTTTWLRWEVRPWKTSSGIVGGIAPRSLHTSIATAYSKCPCPTTAG